MTNDLLKNMDLNIKKQLMEGISICGLEFFMLIYRNNISLQ